MKKYVLLAAVVLLFASCAGMNTAPKYPNMLADMEPFSIGTISVSLDRMFSSKVRETVAEVIFHPRENEVVLEFNTGLAQYRQFWNEAGRQQFIAALNRYQEDFSNQVLTTKYNRTRAAYGKVKGRFQWKTMKFSATYNSSPAIELGYRFKDNAPYFTASQRAAKEESGSNKEGITESPGFPMYYTRAQGEELARLFDQAFLLDTLKGIGLPSQTDSGKDIYIPGVNSVQEEDAAQEDKTEINEIGTDEPDIQGEEASEDF